MEDRAVIAGHEVGQTIRIVIPQAMDTASDFHDQEAAGKHFKKTARHPFPFGTGRRVRFAANGEFRLDPMDLMARQIQATAIHVTHGPSHRVAFAPCRGRLRRRHRATSLDRS
jgi:hypothetical protein